MKVIEETSAVSDSDEIEMRSCDAYDVWPCKQRKQVKSKPPTAVYEEVDL